MTSLLPFLLAMSLQQGSDSVVARATRAIKPLTDSVSLHQAGFVPLAFGPVRDLTPFQGQHWLSLPRIAGMALTNAPVDIDNPTFLMYLPLNGALTPVGVAYTVRIASQTSAPTTFAGMPAMWHTHMFCRNVPGEGQVLSDGLEDCSDRGGQPTRNQIAMIHTWTIPNPDGRIDHDAQMAGTISVLGTHRQALRELVPQLLAAEKAADQPKFDALRKKTISTYNGLLAAYRALASTPQIKSRLDVELSEILGDSGMKMPK